MGKPYRSAVGDYGMTLTDNSYKHSECSFHSNAEGHSQDHERKLG